MNAQLAIRSIESCSDDPSKNAELYSDNKLLSTTCKQNPKLLLGQEVEQKVISDAKIIKKVNTGETIASILRQLPMAAFVFNKLGIEYYCKGKRCFKEECLDAGLNPVEVLLQIEQYAEELSVPLLYDEWSLGLLINYIIENHHSFFKKTIPELIALLEITENTDVAASSTELFTLTVRFKSIAREVKIYMLKEELLVFPIIKEMMSFVVIGKNKASFPYEPVYNQIEVLENENAYINEQMIFLRKFTNNFIPPVNPSQELTLLYKGLEDFEMNLHQYMHLQNNILFPKAIELEHKLS